MHRAGFSRTIVDALTAKPFNLIEILLVAIFFNCGRATT